MKHYKMYGLVPYNISDKQKGIQFLHAVQRYNNYYMKKPKDKTFSCFKEWAFKNETVIMLNGGTTNTNPKKLGTLNKYLEQIKILSLYPVIPFYEEDLGNQLTGFAFLVDARVFDSTLYPEFSDESIKLDKEGKKIRSLRLLLQSLKLA